MSGVNLYGWDYITCAPVEQVSARLAEETSEGLKFDFEDSETPGWRTYGTTGSWTIFPGGHGKQINYTTTLREGVVFNFGGDQFDLAGMEIVIRVSPGASPEDRPDVILVSLPKIEGMRALEQAHSREMLEVALSWEMKKLTDALSHMLLGEKPGSYSSGAPSPKEHRTFLCVETQDGRGIFAVLGLYEREQRNESDPLPERPPGSPVIDPMFLSCAKGEAMTGLAPEWMLRFMMPGDLPRAISGPGQKLMQWDPIEQLLWFPVDTGFDLPDWGLRGLLRGQVAASVVDGRMRLEMDLRAHTEQRGFAYQRIPIDFVFRTTLQFSRFVYTDTNAYDVSVDVLHATGHLLPGPGFHMLEKLQREDAQKQFAHDLADQLAVHVTTTFNQLDPNEDRIGFDHYGFFGGKFGFKASGGYFDECLLLRGKLV